MVYQSRLTKGLYGEKTIVNVLCTLPDNGLVLQKEQSTIATGIKWMGICKGASGVVAKTKGRGKGNVLH